MSIDTTKLKWKYFSINSDCSNRITDFEDVNNYIQTNSICTNITNYANNIKNRIGSKSNNGEVYKVSYAEDKEFVLKIMPIHTSTSKNENLNEIQIARILSNLVINNTSCYFPLVYGNCEDIEVILNELKFLNNVKLLLKLQRFVDYNKSINNFEITDSKFLLHDETIEYRDDGDEVPYYTATIEAPVIDIRLSIDDVKKTIDNLTTDVQRIDNFLQANIGNLKLPDTDDTKLYADILFSEKADMDLKQYIKNGGYDILDIKNNVHTLLDIKNILRSIIFAVIDLQKLSYVHYDLHTGNVLLLINKTDSNIIPLIHDFGKTQKYNNLNTNELRFTDISKLINSISDEYKAYCKNRTDIKHDPDILTCIENLKTRINYYITDSISHQLIELLTEVVIGEQIGGLYYNKYIRSKNKYNVLE